MKNLAVLLLVVLSGAVVASAQEAPKGDFSLGYSYLREGFSDGVNAHGGGISGAGYVNNWFGIAGDFGVYRVSQNGITATTFTYLGGPRLSINRGGSVSPFVQALVGGDRISLEGGSAHGFAWSTGGGVDFALSRHVALRPQLDYIGLRFANTTTHTARASISIVFRFGGR
jgi:hypothetical protein